MNISLALTKLKINSIKTVADCFTVLERFGVSQQEFFSMLNEKHHEKNFISYLQQYHKIYNENNYEMFDDMGIANSWDVSRDRYTNKYLKAILEDKSHEFLLSLIKLYNYFHTRLLANEYNLDNIDFFSVICSPSIILLREDDSTYSVINQRIDSGITRLGAISRYFAVDGNVAEALTIKPIDYFFIGNACKIILTNNDSVTAQLNCRKDKWQYQSELQGVSNGKINPSDFMSIVEDEDDHAFASAIQPVAPKVTAYDALIKNNTTNDFVFDIDIYKLISLCGIQYNLQSNIIRDTFEDIENPILGDNTYASSVKKAVLFIDLGTKKVAVDLFEFVTYFKLVCAASGRTVLKLFYNEPTNEILLFDTVPAVSTIIDNITYQTQKIEAYSYAVFSELSLTDVGTDQIYSSIRIDYLNPNTSLVDIVQLASSEFAPIELKRDIVDEFMGLDSALAREKLIFSIQDKDVQYDYLLRSINKYTSEYKKLHKQGDTIQYDGDSTDLNYVYKVNEIFWFYNKLKVEELLAYFVAEGKDNYNFRKLSYQILGVDYFNFTSLLEPKLLDAGYLMVQDTYTDELGYKKALLRYKYSLMSEDIYDIHKNIKEKREEVIGMYGDWMAAVIDKQIVFFDQLVRQNKMTLNGEKDKKLELSLYHPMFYYDTQEAEEKAVKVGLAKQEYNRSSDRYTPKSAYEVFDIWISAGKITNKSISFQMLKDGYISPIPPKFFIFDHIMEKWVHRRIDSKGLVVTENMPLRFIDELGVEDKNNDSGVLKKDFNWKSIQSNLDVKSRANLKAMGLIEGATSTTTINFKWRSKKDNLSIDNVMDITDAEAKSIYTKILSQYKKLQTVIWEEGNRLFTQCFAESLSTDSKQEVEDEWNRRYNNRIKPEQYIEKIPIFINHGKYFGRARDRRMLSLMDVQVNGIKYNIAKNNASLSQHEVGFGKTISAILTCSHWGNVGAANRPIFFVPHAVYDKFEDEMIGKFDEAGRQVVFGCLPNAKLFKLANLSDKMIELKVKNYTSKEKELCKTIKKITPVMMGVIDLLPAKRVTFIYEDEKGRKKSSFSDYITILKGVIKKEIPDIDNLAVLTDFFSQVESRYNTLQKGVQSIYNKRSDEKDSKGVFKYKSKNKKGDWEFTDNAIASLLKEDAKAAEKFEAFVKVEIKQLYNKFFDALGTIKPEFNVPQAILLCNYNGINNVAVNKEWVVQPLRYMDGSHWMRPLYETRLKNYMHRLIGLEKLNVDGIIVDEIHNYNKIIPNGRKQFYFKANKEPRKRDYFGFFQPSTGGGSIPRLSGVETKKEGVTATNPKTGKKENATLKYKANAPIQYNSKLQGSVLQSKLDLFFVTQALQKSLSLRGRSVKNTLLLSATPFTNSIFEGLSLLHILNQDLLRSYHIGESFQYFINFISEKWKYTVTHDGKFGLFPEVDKYFNTHAGSTMLLNFFHVKTEDSRIRKERPLKLTLPQNDETSNWGIPRTAEEEIFDKFKDVSSYVTLSEAQRQMIQNISDFVIGKIRSPYEIAPSREVQGRVDTSSTTEESLIKDSYFDAINALIKSKDYDTAHEKAAEFYDLFPEDGTVQQLKQKVDALWIGGEEEEIEKEDNEDEGLIEDDSDELIEDDIESSAINDEEFKQARAIRGQLLQELLVVSPYFVKLDKQGKLENDLLPSLSGMGKGMSESAKNFVENSPKIRYTIECLKTIKQYHEKHFKNANTGEVDYSGQVLYMKFGKKFTYGGVEYNAYELLRRYIIDSGLGKEDEIGIITGSTPLEDTVIAKTGRVIDGRITIKDKFNSGQIRYLIGNTAIKEGIDLQGNSTALFTINADFSPELNMQLQGRVWRKGNRWKFVRIVNVLGQGSIDAFVYSKLQLKISQVKRMYESGVYDLNQTQYDIDPKSRFLNIVTDVDELTQLFWQDHKDTLETRLREAEDIYNRALHAFDKYPNVRTKFIAFIQKINILTRAVYDAEASKYKDKIRVRLNNKLREEIREQRDALKRDKDAIKAELKRVREEEKKKKEQEKELNKKKKQEAKAAGKEYIEPEVIEQPESDESENAELLAIQEKIDALEFVPVGIKEVEEVWETELARNKEWQDELSFYSGDYEEGQPYSKLVGYIDRIKPVMYNHTVEEAYRRYANLDNKQQFEWLNRDYFEFKVADRIVKAYLEAGIGFGNIYDFSSETVRSFIPSSGNESSSNYKVLSNYMGLISSKQRIDPETGEPEIDDEGNPVYYDIDSSKDCIKIYRSIADEIGSELGLEDETKDKIRKDVERRIEERKKYYGETIEDLVAKFDRTNELIVLR